LSSTVSFPGSPALVDIQTGFHVEFGVVPAGLLINWPLVCGFLKFNILLLLEHCRTIFSVGCNRCTCNETKLYHPAVKG